MVPMGGVETYSSGRVRPGRMPITLREAVRRIWLSRLTEAREPERHGAEAALLRGAGERIEILAGGGEQAARRGIGQPAVHRGLVRAIVRGSACRAAGPVQLFSTTFQP